ncbi:uncharacterized protein E5676_scaffold648G00470 [Cucumis melo var. makuwa]|uniref:Retrotransposon gag domain-containing protein n=1 Tax=Cucumis melo var. makuwa TaxID=1194695 RepID=A0A5A7U067_CUCMM|nr:uncharacterized protein E6C27_scaffold115G00890 [Cucumis melo var. makuwa]TYK08273.1 uncharacterized protein E5676_scaffold648G00470 [Cucumis melo var. makuwa]
MPRGRPRKLSVAEASNAAREAAMGSEESDAESSRLHVEVNVEEQLLDRLAQGLVSGIRSAQSNLEKNFWIERLKALGATTFAGTTNLADAEAWLTLIEKCFKVMRCLEDRKVELVVFLLKNGTEDWWRLTESRRRATVDMSWDEFKKTFFEKFYSRSFRDAKRSKFLRFTQGSMIVVKYEKKYTKLSKYATSVIKDEVERCKDLKRDYKRKFVFLSQLVQTKLISLN